MFRTNTLLKFWPAATFVAVLVGGLLIGQFYVSGLRAEWREAQNELYDLNTAGLRIEAKEAQKSLIRHDQDVFVRQVPARPFMGDLLHRLNAYLDVQAVAGREVATGSTQPLRPFVRQPVSLQFHGQFSDVIEVLESLERDERLIRVEKLSIRPRTEASQQLRVDLRLATFSREIGPNEH